MELSKKTKIIFASVAAVLLIAAAILAVNINATDELKSVCAELEKRGYNVKSDDLYFYGANADTNIETILSGEDLEKAVKASIESNFPSDVEAYGDIVIMLCEYGDEVITLYLRDGSIELGFIQTLDGEIRSIS